LLNHLRVCNQKSSEGARSHQKSSVGIQKYSSSLQKSVSGRHRSPVVCHVFQCKSLIQIDLHQSDAGARLVFALNAKTLTLSPSVATKASNLQVGWRSIFNFQRAGVKKTKSPHIWRGCARSVRKTGLRRQTSGIRKRDKNRPTAELGRVKIFFQKFHFWFLEHARPVRCGCLGLIIDK
jgi:hypothetical protein